MQVYYKHDVIQQEILDVLETVNRLLTKVTTRNRYSIDASRRELCQSNCDISVTRKKTTDTKISYLYLNKLQNSCLYEVQICTCGTYTAIRELL